MRPPLHRELHDWRPFQNTVHVDDTSTALTVSENLPAYHDGCGGIADGLLYATHRFTFDHVFHPESTQQDVYYLAAQPAVSSMLEGYNATIIAYGQTGTGKTYTMEGVHEDSFHQGIVPRAIKDIFAAISADTAQDHRYLVRASFFQIYNEVITDLLKTDRTNLAVRCASPYRAVCKLCPQGSAQSSQLRFGTSMYSSSVLAACAHHAEQL